MRAATGTSSSSGRSARRDSSRSTSSATISGSGVPTASRSSPSSRRARSSTTATGRRTRSSTSRSARRWRTARRESSGRGPSRSSTPPTAARRAGSSSTCAGKRAQPVSPTLLALLAAASLAISSLFTKRMVGAYPPTQLIGPLLGLNALLVVPFLPFVRWHVSPSIVVLHLASAAALVVSSWCLFELFVHGSASAVAVGQAIAPIPAVIFTAILLSTPVTWPQAAAAGIVSVAVLAALGSSFGALRASHAIALVATAAILNGLLVVLTKLLTERGLGVAEIYFV